MVKKVMSMVSLEFFSFEKPENLLSSNTKEEMEAVVNNKYVNNNNYGFNTSDTR
jgi:hypothetical protein